jgi:hypothetical protein
VMLDSSDSGAGPTIKVGQMIDFSFSKCTVRSLPDLGEGAESREENDEVILGWAWPGETERDKAGFGSNFRLGRWYIPSSANVMFGEEGVGEGECTSSASDTCPLSIDAAKLLEISGSDETKA